MGNLDFGSLKNLPNPILIIGHTGFKGTWLKILLDSYGIRNCGIALKETDDSLFARIGYEVSDENQIVDVRDAEGLKKAILRFNPSLIFHFAAEALVIDSYLNPEKTFSTNVLGTVNVLECSKFLPDLRGVVITTTDKVYKNDATQKFFIENDPLGGYDPYSASKVAQEAVIDAWRSLSQTKHHHPITAVRAGNVIGGGDYSPNRLLPDLVRAKQSNSPLLLRNPEFTRPWQHVLDPIVGYLKVAEKQLEKQNERAFNFSPVGSSISVQNVVNVAKEYWDIRVEQEKEPNQNYRESHYLQLNSEKAFKELGWQALWSQEEAVRRTILWWDQVLEGKITPLQACAKDIKEYLELNNSVRI